MSYSLYFVYIEACAYQFWYVTVTLACIYVQPSSYLTQQRQIFVRCAVYLVRNHYALRQLNWGTCFTLHQTDKWSMKILRDDAVKCYKQCILKMINYKIYTKKTSTIYKTIENQLSHLRVRKNLIEVQIRNKRLRRKSWRSVSSDTNY